MSTKKIKKAKPEYSFLGIEIIKFDVIVDASINYEVRMNTQKASGEERVYSFGTQIEITGICNYPEENVGDIYNLTIYGDDRRQDRFNSRLKDYQVIDHQWQKVFRETKDGMTPVYEIPTGIGYLETPRGSKSGSGYAWVSTRFVSDMLLLLTINRPMYIEIHRLKEGRGYAISSLSLKTTNPKDT